MQAYQHIVVAVDLSPEAQQVLARAQDLAAHYGARISLVHVVEPVVTDVAYDLMPAVPVEIETDLVERARQYLESLAEEAGLSDSQRLVEVGSVKGELLRLAQEQGVDLIVVGTHGRHGVSMMLGSTANAVLHGTPCDVLAVRVQ
ncbi:MAG TPA: universal stress protein [Gammaproteobacteria bacterium]|nr:universal stress protein [Gammaproteobacteria bacterium]